MARVQYFGKTTASTSVTVYWAGTTTKPTIYGSATGSSISNPLTSSFEGDYSFWVDEGHYKILNGKLVNGVATNIDDAYILSTQGAEPTASKSSLAPFQTNTATDVEEWVEGAYTGSTYVAASALKSATTVVGVAAATAPSSGQVLTATSSTTATWQTPSTVTVPGADTNLVYNDGGVLGADANLTWNKTTKVHTLTGGYYSNTQAVAATSTDGVVLSTSSTATAGNPKYSPRVRLRGSLFNGSAQTTDWIIENEGIDAASAGALYFKHSLNGAAYVYQGVFDGGGTFYASNGVAVGTLAALGAEFTSGQFYSKSTFVYSWSSGSNPLTADTGLSRISAGVVGIGNGSASDFSGTVKYTQALEQSANGAQWIQGQASELLTLSTSGTTTDTSANLLPANSIIEAVVALVTTTITTATDWKLGDPTTAGRFTAANATMTAGTTDIGLVHCDQTGAAGPKQTTAAKVRVTTTGTPGAGAIRITVFYRQFVAPTS